MTAAEQELDRRLKMQAFALTAHGSWVRSRRILKSAKSEDLDDPELVFELVTALLEQLEDPDNRITTASCFVVALIEREKRARGLIRDEKGGARE